MKNDKGSCVKVLLYIENCSQVSTWTSLHFQARQLLNPNRARRHLVFRSSASKAMEAHRHPRWSLFLPLRHLVFFLLIDCQLLFCSYLFLIFLSIKRDVSREISHELSQTLVCGFGQETSNPYGDLDFFSNFPF